MKKTALKVLVFLLIVLLCAGCGALPGEENVLDIEVKPRAGDPETENDIEADPPDVHKAQDDNAVYGSLELTADEIVSWALGCSAILATHNGFEPYQFGMLRKNDMNTDLAKELLSSGWNCRSREDALGIISRMTDNGHSSGFAETYDFLCSLSEEEYDELLETSTDIEIYMWPQTKLFGDRWGDKQIKAWDWFRMIHVAGWGYVADYLELEEAYELMVPVIARLRGSFFSWEEANDNYMDGYAWWSHSDISDTENEYHDRMIIYGQLKRYPPEVSLYDPALWPDYVESDSDTID